MILPVLVLHIGKFRRHHVIDADTMLETLAKTHLAARAKGLNRQQWDNMPPEMRFSRFSLNCSSVFLSP